MTRPRGWARDLELDWPTTPPPGRYGRRTAAGSLATVVAIAFLIVGILGAVVAKGCVAR